MTRWRKALNAPSAPVTQAMLPNLDTSKSDSGAHRPRAGGVELGTLLEAALAANTLRAYRSDLSHFLGWAGKLPVDPHCVARYLAAHADRLRPSTLERRLASLSAAHRIMEAPDPTKSLLVRRTLRGIKRLRGAGRRKATAITAADLRAIAGVVNSSLPALRDKACLLIGFAGALRRSELVAIAVEHLSFDPSSLKITIPKGKTDQLAMGRVIVIPRVEDQACCPVAALEQWLAMAKITEGPIFRPITGSGEVLPRAISGRAVADILKRRLASVGINPTGYSAHSLRAGFITTGIVEGVELSILMSQTGHKTPTALAGYVRPTPSDLGRTFKKIVTSTR